MNTLQPRLSGCLRIQRHVILPQMFTDMLVAPIVVFPQKTDVIFSVSSAPQIRGQWLTEGGRIITHLHG